MKAGALKCARLEFSGCRVKPRRPQRSRGFTQQSESPNVHTSGSRPLKREREKKERNFGWSGVGVVQRRGGPAEEPSSGGGGGAPAGEGGSAQRPKNLEDTHTQHTHHTQHTQLKTPNTTHHTHTHNTHNTQHTQLKTPNTTHTTHTHNLGQNTKNTNSGNAV